MRERWLGATGVRVPAIAVEGEDVVVPDDSHVELAGTRYEALIFGSALDKKALRRAHETGVPVVVRGSSAAEVQRALANPEVACVVVPPSARELRDLDLVTLTYG